MDWTHLDMTDFETLPGDRYGGTYFVLTASGTTHVMNFDGRLTWQRLADPAGDGGVRSAPKAVASIDDGWRVGSCGHLLCADETYQTGATWHVTAEIVRITDDPNSPGPDVPAERPAS